MSDTVIKVENVGKLYRLGEIGTGTISHDLNRWWARVRGKEDPFGKIGETNDRTTKGNSDYVWSLKDINFDVKQGEVLGIIGRNGAGKSTLLKILSKVTTPTQGRIKVKGRIASLLEVGTGFHPELTGRENIYLNGAILGMTKAEINKKFDEIVDFSGVERYIDTPVKRYSSGMYVRLAFAVAAFLEPEILIVDEVLAVGDTEFQKKCLGRMKDVSTNDGRTVLFVSHNMASISELCNKGIFLKNGTINNIGNIKEIVETYLNSNSGGFRYNNNENNDSLKPMIQSVELNNGTATFNGVFKNNEDIIIQIEVINLKMSAPNTNVSIIVKDKYETPLFSNHQFLGNKRNKLNIKITIPKDLLLPGLFHMQIVLHDPMIEFIDNRVPLLNFEVEDIMITEHSIYRNSQIGVLNIKSEWEINETTT
jgi:lipopolysaccharide transport system ATP-binding protein